jgi:hypothetical protein
MHWLSAAAVARKYIHEGFREVFFSCLLLTCNEMKTTLTFASHHTSWLCDSRLEVLFDLGLRFIFFRSLHVLFLPRDDRSVHGRD